MKCGQRREDATVKVGLSPIIGSAIVGTALAGSAAERDLAFATKLQTHSLSRTAGADYSETEPSKFTHFTRFSQEKGPAQHPRPHYMTVPDFEQAHTSFRRSFSLTGMTVRRGHRPRIHLRIFQETSNACHAWL